MGKTCYKQGAERGRGACFECGKGKVRCSNSLRKKDGMPASETKARARVTRKTQRAPRESSVESEEETEAPTRNTRRRILPTKPSASSSLEEDSLSQLVVKDEGKGLQGRSKRHMPVIKPASPSASSSSDENSPPRRLTKDKGKKHSKCSISVPY